MRETFLQEGFYALFQELLEGIGRGHSGPGLYLHYEACRDEGSIFLGPEADA